MRRLSGDLVKELVRLDWVPLGSGSIGRVESAAEDAAQDVAAVWRGDPWRVEVERWVRSRLSQAGITVVGPAEQVRLKPWSTHLVVATDRGRYWFKENCPALRFEAGLVATLSQLVPGRVLEPLAIDLDRGRLLTPDGGATLDQSRAPADIFVCALAEFGVVQRALAHHSTEVVTTGLPVVPADQAADHFERQLRDLRRLPAGHPLHIDEDVITRAARFHEIVDNAASQLAETPLPDSLQHNDLQPSNVFEPRQGSLRFFDFGDAVWSHPFSVLNVMRYRVAQAWNCSIEDRRIAHLIDSYLDGWTEKAPIQDLRRLVEPAMTVAKLHRYNSWHQLIPYMPNTELRRHAGYAEALISPSGAR